MQARYQAAPCPVMGASITELPCALQPQIHLAFKSSKSHHTFFQPSTNYNPYVAHSKRLATSSSNSYQNVTHSPIPCATILSTLIFEVKIILHSCISPLALRVKGWGEGCISPHPIMPTQYYPISITIQLCLGVSVFISFPFAHLYLPSCLCVKFCVFGMFGGLLPSIHCNYTPICTAADIRESTAAHVSFQRH